jgi:tetrahydromethanopterin:alpha-L-glutamate ligase
MRLGIVAHRATPTNLALAGEAPPGVEAIVLPPLAALHLLRPGDVALGRLDVRESVDGVEDGLWHLERLACAGVTVFNSSPTLRLAHDKRLTATVLTGAGLPHPRTVSVRDGRYDPPLPFPFVLKPRFGSWGTDVVLCEDEESWLRAASSLSTRTWYSRCGALAQELVPPLGHDLRILVARGRVVGAIKRVAPPGEWRTNIALGATRRPVDPPPVAQTLALAAAATVGGDLVGVDLLPTGPGTYVVLEVNGAVDFTGDYAPGGNVFAAAVGALVRAPQLAAIA